jgi:hypothetical protein
MSRRVQQQAGERKGLSTPGEQTHETNGQTKWVLLSPGYGFAVLLTDVEEGWPEFGKHCAPKRTKDRDGASPGPRN